MGQIKFIGALLLFAVFSIAVVTFMITFAYENNASFNLDDEAGWNNTNNVVKENLSTYHINVINSSTSFYESEILEGETVQTGGQFKLGPATALSATQNYAKQGYKAIFGNDPAFAIILTTLFSFLGFVLVMVIWKTWAGRNPE